MERSQGRLNPRIFAVFEFSLAFGGAFLDFSPRPIAVQQNEFSSAGLRLLEFSSLESSFVDGKKQTNIPT